MKDKLLKLLSNYYFEITKEHKGIIKLDEDFIINLLKEQNFDITMDNYINKIQDIMFNFKNKTVLDRLKSMDKVELLKYVNLDEQDKKFALCATMRTHMLDCSLRQDKSRSVYNKEFLLSDMNRFINLSIDVIEKFNFNDELKLSILENHNMEDLLTKQNIDIMSDYFAIVEEELEDTSKLLM